MKLMADNYEDDHLKTAPDQTNHKPSPDQVTFSTSYRGTVTTIVYVFTRIHLFKISAAV